MEFCRPCPLTNKVTGGSASTARFSRHEHLLAANAETTLIRAGISIFEGIMTKAMRIHANGGPEVFRWEDVEIPPPGEGQAQIRHTAIGIN
jgi:hypothetical protein